ncbi:MAG: hypothetical protein KA419_01270 [Acidobacteria bacterium]|nr:hypothetical protein [Acidobacteriota bacterium]
MKKKSPIEQDTVASGLPPSFTHHLSRAERLAFGKSLREKCPRKAHAKWEPPPGRPGPDKPGKETTDEHG